MANRVEPGVQDLELALGHTFTRKNLLLKALSHRSSGADNNERLEYLGDALLGFVVAHLLFELHPDATEGELTRLRASLVKGETLAKIARKIKLGNYIKLGPSELKSGGWRRQSILANSMEAIIGAIYLDSDIDSCRQTIKELFSDLLDKSSPANLEKDPKTRIQEYLQAQQYELPMYEIINETGEPHNRRFVVKCLVKDLSISVEADGLSKRMAEQAAAQKILDILEI